MTLHCERIVVPDLLVSERIIVELRLAGILRFWTNNPHLNASNFFNGTNLKVQSLCLPLDFYSFCRDEPEGFWSGWRRCWGQRNGFSAGVVRAYTLDFDIWIWVTLTQAFDTHETSGVCLRLLQTWLKLGFRNWCGQSTGRSWII